MQDSMHRWLVLNELGSATDSEFTGEKKFSAQEPPLNAWKRYTQVVLLTNELIFVN